MPDSAESAPEMRRPSRILTGTFIATVAVFSILIAFILLQESIPRGEALFRYVFFSGVAALIVVGLALLVLAMRSRLERGLRRALILTGVAALGAPVSAILHNAVYALMVLLSERGIWRLKEGADEGVFFILAVVGFPVLFVVSAVFGIVLLWRASVAVRASRT